MPTDNRLQFRAGPEVLPHLDARAGRLPRHLVAERDLGRYYAVLSRSLPAFSEPEASLIVDALNGSLLDTATVHLLWAEVDDAIRLDGLAEKWRVDGPVLVARLRDLSYAQALAVYDASERYWLADGEHAERLRAVGLVR